MSIPATLVAVLLAGGTALAVQPFGETDFSAIIGDAHNNHFAGAPFATVRQFVSATQLALEPHLIANFAHPQHNWTLHCMVDKLDPAAATIAFWRTGQQVEVSGRIDKPFLGGLMLSGCRFDTARWSRPR